MRTRQESNDNASNLVNFDSILEDEGILNFVPQDVLARGTFKLSRFRLILENIHGS